MPYVYSPFALSVRRGLYLEQLPADQACAAAQKGRPDSAATADELAWTRGVRQLTSCRSQSWLHEALLLP